MGSPWNYKNLWRNVYLQSPFIWNNFVIQIDKDVQLLFCFSLFLMLLFIYMELWQCMWPQHWPMLSIVPRLVDWWITNIPLFLFTGEQISHKLYWYLWLERPHGGPSCQGPKWLEARAPLFWVTSTTKGCKWTCCLFFSLSMKALELEWENFIHKHFNVDPWDLFTQIFLACVSFLRSDIYPFERKVSTYE